MPATAPVAKLERYRLAVRGTGRHGAWKWAARLTAPEGESILTMPDGREITESNGSISQMRDLAKRRGWRVEEVEE